MPGRHSQERPGSVLSDLGFSLDRLFDPENYDSTTAEKYLKKYANRHDEMTRTKLFKIAVKVFGVQQPRRRVIVAPPMEKIETTRFRDTQEIPSQVPLLSLKPSKQIQSKSKDDDAEIDIEEFDSKEVKEYKKWVKERKKLRKDVETMGLSEEWLANKPDKTPLELSMLQKFIEERTPKRPTPEPELYVPMQGELADNLPQVRRPAPLAIKAIHEYLQSNNMRLIDLFRKVDKDKNWTISRDEFHKIIRQNNIPISDILLEDLMLALDTDLNDELDYRELNAGLEQYKAEKRESQRKIKSPGKSSLTSASIVPGRAPTDSRPKPEKMHSDMTGMSTHQPVIGPVHVSHSSPAVMFKSPQPEVSPLPKTVSTFSTLSSMSSPSRVKSALSTISSRSSPTLEPPEPDLRPEQMILSSEEAMLDLRKRDREALARALGKKLPKSATRKKRMTTEKSMIKTGNRAVDDHCRPSTLTKETAEMVDKFRQLKLKEYNEVVRLCKENDMALNIQLFEKVLLHPPDKPHSLLKKKIRQPGVGELMSSHFADPPKKPRTPMELKHKDKVKVSKTGQLLIDTRHMYPQRSKVADGGYKMNLSTGRAVVRRQVDCWMTFEEYDRLTSKFAVRYKQLHGGVDDNAFWPGHLLDKLRLCMPPYDKPTLEPGSRALFQQTRGEIPVNQGYASLDTWQANDGGYIQQGTYDPYFNKSIV